MSLGHQPGALLRKQERKLPGLREPKAGQQRRPDRIPEHLAVTITRPVFICERPRSSAAGGGQWVLKIADLEQHPDRDEEKAREIIPKGHDLGHDMLAVLGLGNNKPGQESAEREGQPQAVSDPCRSEAEKQHEQKENFPVLEPNDLVKQERNDPPGGQEDDHEAHNRFAERDDRPKGESPPPPAGPSTGSRSIMGTTAMSWKSRMPVASLPWAESSSARSLYILSTMAVLLSEARKPKKTAWGSGNPRKRAIPATARSVSSTCIPPPIRNWRPERKMSWIENSSPTVNNNRTTPMSASRSTTSVSRDDAGAERTDEHAGDQESYQRGKFCPVEQIGYRERYRQQDDELAQYDDLLVLHRCRYNSIL